MRGAIHRLPQYAFMKWCLVKAQGQLYLYQYGRALNVSNTDFERKSMQCSISTFKIFTYLSRVSLLSALRYEQSCICPIMRSRVPISVWAWLHLYDCISPQSILCDEPVISAMSPTKYTTKKSLSVQAK
jgi:hypothetical protein